VTRESTSPASWSISRLIAALEAGERDDENAPHVIKIPQFQRTVVWGEKKQGELIDSIHRGFPIGSLMLYEKSTDGEQKQYQLVDGLQRACSIWDYKRKPLTFFRLNRVGPEIQSIIEEISNLTNDDITVRDLAPVLDKWRLETKTTELSDGFDTFKLMTFLGDKFSIPMEVQSSLHEPCMRFLESVKEKLNIDSQEIPIIIYEGDSKHLPTIFERINTGSVELSKYQILAAQWVDISVRTENSEIIQAIDRKNQSLEEKGFKIDKWDESRGSAEPSLYEYLFGLGKVVAEKYPLLFSSKEPHEEESIGFALATVVRGLPISKMSEIGDKFPTELGYLNMRMFSSVCDEACSFVQDILEPFIGLKLNSRKQKLSHSVNQIISMISRCMVGMYDTESWESNDAWNSEKEILERTLRQHYLVDLVQRNWKGSGDSRLFNMTWKLTSEGDHAPSNHYLSEFDKSRYASILDNWFESQIEKSEVKRAVAPEATKIFLKYLYCDCVSFRNNITQTYEIEHLFPVSRLVAILRTSDDEGWPINCVANLCLFIDSTNRDKSSQTLLEYYNILEREGKRDLEEQLDGMLFCDLSEVSISENNQFRLSNYNIFLRERFSTMRDLVIENLELEERLSEPEVDDSEIPIEEESTYSESVSQSDILSVLIVSPTPTFFSFGFNIPTDDCGPFVDKFQLTRENLRVGIVLEINDQQFDSRIRIQFQKNRDVVQFNFLSKAKRELSRLFAQSFLDVTNGEPSSEKCRINHLGENLFRISKVEQ